MRRDRGECSVNPVKEHAVGDEVRGLGGLDLDQVLEEGIPLKAVIVVCVLADVGIISPRRLGDTDPRSVGRFAVEVSNAPKRVVLGVLSRRMSVELDQLDELGGLRR
jgi:hypothetical protein